MFSATYFILNIEGESNRFEIENSKSTGSKSSGTTRLKFEMDISLICVCIVFSSKKWKYWNDEISFWCIVETRRHRTHKHNSFSLYTLRTKGAKRVLSCPAWEPKNCKWMFFAKYLPTTTRIWPKVLHLVMRKNGISFDIKISALTRENSKVIGTRHTP